MQVCGYPDRPVTARKVIELAQDAQILDGSGYVKLVILAWDYDYNYSTEFENRKKALNEPLRISLQPLTIPSEIYNYLRKPRTKPTWTDYAARSSSTKNPI